MLTLPLLGERPYLHGTTLFESLVPLAPAGARLEFKVSRMLMTDRVELRPFADAKGVSASLEWHGAEGSGGVCVYPLPPSPSPSRVPYDEQRVASRAAYDADAGRVSLEEKPPFPLAATLVPLMKLLLRHSVSPPDKGQWVFTRLDLDALPDPFWPLSLTYAGAVNRGRLVRARLLMNQHVRGTLYFSWLPQAAAPGRP